MSRGTKALTEKQVKGLLVTQGPMTMHQLAEHFKTSRRVVSDRIAQLRAESEVYLSEWRKTPNGQWSPVYAAGFSDDVPRPPNLRKLQDKPGPKRAYSPRINRASLGVWGGLI